MRIKLKDHQIAAVFKMKNGCILCGGVGSGKSRTAIAYYYLINGGNKNCLYGTKDYVHMKKPIDLYIITTPHKRDTFEWLGDMAPFLISTHQEATPYKNKVVIDSWNNIKKYVQVQDSFFIFDEQRVIGKGEWVKSFLKIVKNNQWILLSATPGDTWSDYIPVFIANGFYKNRTDFNERHIVWSRFSKFPKVDRYLSTGILLKHRNDILVDMNFLRPTVSHDEPVYVNYDTFLYKETIKNRQDPYNTLSMPNGTVVQKPIKTASEFCYILRRIVNTSASRQIALLEILEKHDKVIIFYNYNYELDILKGLYYGDDVQIAEWNGQKHEPIPKSAKWIYLVQYTAGAEGWNCIETDTIIFYSQNYSYKVLVQAKGRIDRMNTPFKDLYYYYLKSRSGIDLAISKALENKKKFNERTYYSYF